jgi:hypothetical protein
MVVARLIRTVASIVAAVMVVAILLRVLGANHHNAIVSDIHDDGQVLVGPFSGMFSVGSAKASMAVNWGIAAFVYLILGHFVARMVAYAVPRARWARPAVGR